MWRKSSHSAQQGACVELDDVLITDWRKAKSCHANGTCVEVASVRKRVAVRDSKNPELPFITVNPDFISDIKRAHRIISALEN